MRCVTTTRRINYAGQVKARLIAEQLGMPLLQRGDVALTTLLEEHGMLEALVVGHLGLSIENGKSKLIWHPNMSAFKLRDLNSGIQNPMLRAMDLRQGDFILDCTLGLAGDAIVISSAVGKEGRVVGLEGNPLIAQLTKDGLSQYGMAKKSDLMLTEAMARIEVIAERYETYLSVLDADTFDIVYFDPMFDKTITTSSAMQTVSDFAIKDVLTLESFEMAMRIARKRVVVKLRRDSMLHHQLPFTDFICRTRHDQVGYAYVMK